MYYRNYNNGGNFIWLGLLLFIFFGGFRTLLLFIPIIFSLFPVFIVAIVIFKVLGGINKNAKLGRHVRVSTKERSKFMELLVRILIQAVQADGKVDQRELQIIRQFFQVNLRLTKMDMVWVNDLMQHALKSKTSLIALCQEFSQFDPQAKLILLELVYQVVASDNVITRSEETFIERLVSLLRINRHDHERIRRHYQRQESNNDQQSTKSESYYDILGINKNASSEEIKKAYKTACKKYHPDKVQHLGDEFRKVAETKIKKINAAYAALRR
eukprot:COSAG01_NODE_662_length_14431_cov_31.385775_9_plen_271_part_00